MGDAVEEGRTARRAAFLAALTFETIPPSVVESIEDLFVDWLRSARAGAKATPTRWSREFAPEMAPVAGPSTDFSGGEGTSPFFAADVDLRFAAIRCLDTAPRFAGTFAWTRK